MLLYLAYQSQNLEGLFHLFLVTPLECRSHAMDRRAGKLSLRDYLSYI